MDKKVLLLLLKGFESMEASPFIDIMGWARKISGSDITVDTFGYNTSVQSSFGFDVTPGFLLEPVRLDEYALNYDALAIPGGFGWYGFYEEAYKEETLDLIRRFHHHGKIIATVCVGALPVGKSGVLKGRKGTTYHLEDGNRQRQLEAFGVEIVQEPVVTDENIITSYCPQTAPEVAFRLLAMLAGEEKATEVRKMMGFQ